MNSSLQIHNEGAPLSSEARNLRAKRRTAKAVLLAAIAGSVVGLAGSNPLLTAAGLLLVPVLFMLLWRTGEPPALLFAACFQWLEAFTPVMLANVRGERLGEPQGLPEMVMAEWLALLAILVVAIGMRHGRGRAVIALDHATEHGSLLTPTRLFVAYVVAHALAFVATGASTILPGARQILLPTILLRWAVFFLIVWCAVRQPKFRIMAVCILLFEIVIGFGGFFGAFKTILFLTIIVLITERGPKFALFRPGPIAVAGLVLLLGAYWQAIKVDYRAFLNQGAGTQAVLVSPGERFEFLVGRMVEVGPQDLYEGLISGVERLGYLEFFARSIQTVPAHVPYQEGRLWMEAVEHIAMPRLFFPKKEAISDSERTSEFSGMQVAGDEQGTSISIGYPGESYIDFGPLLMFVPVYLVGLLWGASYRWLIRLAGNPLLGMAIATNLILNNALGFGVSNIKILGGTVTSLVFLSLLLAFGRKRIWSLLTGR